MPTSLMFHYNSAEAGGKLQSSGQNEITVSGQLLRKVFLASAIIGLTGLQKSHNSQLFLMLQTQRSMLFLSELFDPSIYLCLIKSKKILLWF